jgi:N-acetylglucosaminyl-diphospho-decaprenol L-rhamnosyltransferase
VADPRVSLVLITRDRREDLMRTLPVLEALPERPTIHLVDNASRDGTPDAVRARFPSVDLVPLEANLGAAARNLGVERARTPYVAFNDDDSWWAPGALTGAADLLDRHPRLGLVNARILVGEEQRADPVCVEMADGGLPQAPGQPGVAIRSFVACGAIVRRRAFLDAGGFHPRLGVGGEEELLAHALARAGWQLSYVPELVVHHHPSTARDAERRSATEVRNALWTAWLTRPPRRAAAATLALLRPTGAALRGTRDAIRGAGWVWRERRRLDQLDAGR